MKLTFTVDTLEMFDEENGEGFLVKDFSELLTDGLKRSIIAESKNKIASDKFSEFQKLVSDTIVSDIKLRMQNFLNEEIVLTEDWGKTKFVGSVEDLIKLRFDDTLLRPVDSSGKKLQGCTSSGKTWIEWMIEKQINDGVKDIINSAQRTILSEVKKAVEHKIVEIKDRAIKEQVDAAFVSILKK